MSQRLPRWCGCFLAVAVQALGCAHSVVAAKGDAAGSASTEVQTAPAEFRLGPADVIDVSVWKNEAVSRVVPVRPDGMISLPLINDVRAAGETPMELRREITDRLAIYLPSPEVSVIVREVHSVRVSVQGEVAHPGDFEMKGPTTVLEILARAGGVTPFASRSELLVLRPHSGWTERISLDRDRILNHGAEDLMLCGGDLVFVP